MPALKFPIILLHTTVLNKESIIQMLNGVSVELTWLCIYLAGGCDWILDSYSAIIIVGSQA